MIESCSGLNLAMRPSLRVSFRIQICRNSRRLVVTACIWMFDCSISMQCAPLWNILNICKEWMGISWPYAYVQLQEAIRTAKVFEKLQWFGHAPKLQRFLSNLWEQSGSYSMQMYVWVQDFNAVGAPQIETFWMLISARNEGGPADPMRCCKKQSERPKCLRVAVGWAYAPQVFPFKFAGIVW